jgi:asparagine synthase (glutamine-hydrolysing)
VPKRYEEQVEQFRELFTDACRIRMRADVPISFTLSGGLDSSAIVSTVVKKIRPKDNISVFIASLTGTFLDETPYALQVTNDLCIPANTVAIAPQKAWELLEQHIYLFEELYLTGPSPMMMLYAAIRQKGGKVCIDGHGADELLSGYGHLTETLLDCGLRLWQVPEVLAAINGFSNLSTPQIGFKPYDWCYYLRFVASRFRHQPRELLRFLTRENPSQRQFGFLNKTLWRLFHQESLLVLLRNYDRYSMANGVESRMPFMDYRLVVYLFSLTWQSKVRKGMYKAILRDAMQGIVTDKVRLRQDKIGFNMPIVDWMRGAWREPLRDMLSDTAFNSAALIDAPAVRRAVMRVIDNTSAKYSDGEAAWIALMPYLWERAVMQRRYSLIN